MTDEIPESARLHWGRATVRWDGDDAFRLELPHYIDTWPVAWLERHVADRIRAAGFHDLLCSITEANPTRRPNSVGWDEPGFILVSNLRAPLDDASGLRDVLEDAVDDAYEAAREAEGRAAQLLGAIRDGS